MLQSATAGAAGTLLLEGTAGVGTTRFIDEVISRLDALHEPMTVLRGCSFGEATDPLHAPLVRALRPALAELPDDALAEIMGQATDELLRLLPELATRLGAGREAGSHALTTVPERRQARLLEGILGVMGRLGERRPALLVIEDLHRADAGTRTLVTFLARIARLQRLAIVGTYQADAIRRDDPWADRPALPRRRPAPAASHDARPARPRRSGPPHRGDEGERPSASVLVVVVERSGGRPLVAEELLAHGGAADRVADLDLRGSGAGADGGPLDRGAAGAPVARSRRTPAVPRNGGRRGRGLRDRRHERAVIPTGSARRHGDGVLDADLSAGLDEALAHGFALENADGVFLRHELVGRA